MNYVFWDFDGTLAERPGRWSGCMLDIIKRRCPDLVPNEAALRAGLHAGYPWHTPEIEHTHLTDATAWWDALTPALAAACVAGGVDPATSLDVARDVRTAYGAASEFTVYDDAVDALTLLTDNGWRHAIVSNHVPELAELVDGLGIAAHFEAVFSSAVTGYEKPHPRAFGVAIDALNPAKVWMVGDNPKADVAGAEAVSIPALLVRRDADDPTPLLTAARHILESAR